MVEKPIFLETSIQADRVIGKDDRKKTVKANLKGKALMSSKCVLGEFRDTVMRDAVLFHKVLIDSPDSNEALKRYPTFRPRGYSRAVAIYASVTDEYHKNKADVLDVLEQWIEWGLLHRFNEGLVMLIEGASCAKANATPVKENETYRIDGRLSCRKASPPNCSIAEFISSHREELLAIIGAIKGLAKKDDAQTQMVEQGEKVALGSESPFGTTCQHLKDIIIALEAPAESAIYTTNTRHFKPICAAIGRELYEEKQL